MNLFITLFCLTVLAADLWALRRILTSMDSPRDKFLFSLVVVLLPVIGLILWQVTGTSSSFVKKNKYTQGEY